MGMMSGKDLKKGGGCMIVFGLVFFLAGLAPGIIATNTLIKNFRAQSWEAVDARVVSARLNSSTDSEGSTTYSVEGSFRYRYRGADYVSDQVSFDTGSDNIGSFHQDAYNQLASARQSGQSITAWVNPESPSEAVIFRDIRWGMVLFLYLFLLVFSGVGLGIMLFVIIGMRRLKRQQKKIVERRAANQLEPLSALSSGSESTAQFSDWELAFPDHEIKSGSTGTMWFVLIFAVIWNLISMSVFFIIPDAIETGDYMALIALLFPLIGIGLAIWAVRAIIQTRKFGQCMLMMNSFPASPGSMLRATLEIPRPVQADEMELSLACLKRTTSGSGKNRSTRESLLWEDHLRTQVLNYGDEGAAVQVRFSIPRDAQSSSGFNGSDGIVWRLSASAEVPGVDFSHRFELPVIETDARIEAADNLMDAISEPFSQPKSAVASVIEQIQQTAQAYTDADGSRGDWHKTGAVFDPVMNRYHFRGNRSWAGTLITGLVLLVLTGACMGFFMSGHPIVGGILSLFAAALAYAFYSMLCRTDIDVTVEHLRRARGILIMGAGRRWQRNDIDRFEIVPGTQVNGRQYYRIRLINRSGAHHTLVTLIRNRHDGQALIDRWAQKLRLSAT